jgi:hypothetical protein
LRARFPNVIASHGREQDFYFGDDFLFRRHDYQLEIAGAFTGKVTLSDLDPPNGYRLSVRGGATVRLSDDGEGR